ncbi:asialoglycoprotein receptor 2-like [Mytilus trossulus]|uniref:asialoglycoprotein receptor 2-like n=1 Tax=Mytilus trossulus TaxID=6551 RepID=UPI0030070409
MTINSRCSPGDWIYYNNSCYSIELSLANFTDARNHCKNKDSDLVIIRSKEEYNFIVSHTSKKSGADFWIGLKKLRNEIYKWIDGSNPTYLPWGQQHRQQGYEGYYDFCTKSSSMEGTWAGDYCSNTNRFICEKQLL